MTGDDNYFEDFQVGAVFRHARGKTITWLENVYITNLVLNTAQAHFNEHQMRNTEHDGVVSFGGVQLSLVLGLASQDCCENAVAELGLDRVRFFNTVSHGMTLYAVTEVLEKHEGKRADAGVVLFRHYGLDELGELILQVDREVLIWRRQARSN